LKLKTPLTHRVYGVKLISKRRSTALQDAVFEKCTKNERRFDCLFRASFKKIILVFFGVKMNTIYRTFDSTEDIK